MVPLSKGRLHIVSCTLHTGSDSSDRPGICIWFILHPRGIYLLEATRTLSTNWDGFNIFNKFIEFC